MSLERNNRKDEDLVAREWERSSLVYIGAEH